MNDNETLLMLQDKYFEETIPYKRERILSSIYGICNTLSKKLIKTLCKNKRIHFSKEEIDEMAMESTSYIVLKLHNGERIEKNFAGYLYLLGIKFAFPYKTKQQRFEDQAASLDSLIEAIGEHDWDEAN